MIKIAVVALIGVFASMILKRINSNLSYCAVIVTGVIIIGFLYVDMTNFVNIFIVFKTEYGISDGYIKLLLKVLGISYITQFGSSLAEECGEKFIAKKIEFAGKILIISLSIPILLNLLNTVIGLI